MTLRAARLRELFDYDPETGAFVRRVTRSSNARSGDVAGCLTPYGYLVINIDGKLYMCHRLAWLYMTGGWPSDLDVDHIDGNRANNRWSNLRLATRSQNLSNRQGGKGKTGVRGVTLSPKGRYVAKIWVRYRPIHIGTYDTLEEAKRAREAAGHKYHGEFRGEV